jgi:acetate kinase
MMGTRTGDLDPGVLLYLMRHEGLDADSLDACVNREAGLLGVSGASSDVRDLLAREADDPHAAEALELYCYQARKHVGALVAALGGLDTLVFTGGVGEHAAPVRQRICDGLAYLGVRLDAARNAAHAAVISTSDASVTVRVMPTDEDWMIARNTRPFLGRDIK